MRNAKRIKQLFLLFILAVILFSCKKEVLKPSVCGTVWDKGRDNRGWFLTVDDRQVYVDSARWNNTETNTQYCTAK